jgi:hypothetical protein
MYGDYKNSFTAADHKLGDIRNGHIGGHHHANGMPDDDFFVCGSVQRLQ